jgi:hypothetical protein
LDIYSSHPPQNPICFPKEKKTLHWFYGKCIKQNFSAQIELKILPWVGTNGTTSSSSLNVFEKTPKFLRTKLKILELHQNKF